MFYKLMYDNFYSFSSSSFSPLCLRFVWLQVFHLDRFATQFFTVVVVASVVSGRFGSSRSDNMKLKKRNEKCMRFSQTSLCHRREDARECSNPLFVEQANLFAQI